MDNLCHTLAGAAIGEAGLRQRTRFGAPMLMVAANIPDLDVLVFLTDTSSLSFRRGWTHGVIGQVLLPLALTGIFWAIDRWRPRRDGPPLDAGWLLLLGYIGIYSHVLLDLLNTYGVRLLTPVDWRWWYGDSVFIVDLWLWLALGIGVWLSRRRQQSRPARRGLVVAACYIAAMVLSSRVGRGIVVDQWRDAHGSDPRAVMVGPRVLTPLSRDVIVDAGDRYEAGTFSWLTPQVTWSPPRPKNDRLPEVAAARGEPGVREFLVWSRFPFWELERQAEGTRVIVRDMRFAGGGRQFSAEALVRPSPSAPEPGAPR